MSRSQLNQSEYQSPSPSLSSIPDSIEPVVAWRAWIVGAADLALYSCYYPNYSGPWRGKKTAKAGRGLDYGFHAFKEKEDALSWGKCHWEGKKNWVILFNNYNGVYQKTLGSSFFNAYDYRVGQVVLWGDIVEYEDGYRAEFAMRRDEWERVENFT